MHAPRYPETGRITCADVAALLPPRPADSHKGRNGNAALLCGSAAYTGAALLASAAALRAGCGILRAYVPACVKPAFSSLPEAICIEAAEGGDWTRWSEETVRNAIEKADAIGMGCGMDAGVPPALLSAAIHAGKKLVLDADALNALAAQRTLFDTLHGNVVLTPHAGEMARLCGISVEQVTHDPVETARSAARNWHCCVLLKGAFSTVADASGAVRINETGNPGLAKGGSGDVLAGLITGLMAQGLRAFDAACAGAYLLGTSADQALLLLGNRMLLARDVVSAIRDTIDAV